MPPRLKVLLVEGDPAYVERIRGVLADSGLGDPEVAQVSTLASALELLGAGDVDLTMVDLELSDSHGLDTLRRLREAAPHVPALVLTGSDDDEVAVAAVRLGAEGSVFKARVDGAGLRRSARLALERARARSREYLAREVLEVLNQREAPLAAVREILQLIGRVVGLRAVGILLREGDGYQYFRADGSTDVVAEREATGSPELACMCGRVLAGRTEPALPCFTPGGSFWTNGAGELAAGATAAGLPAWTCSRCGGAGDASLALIPLRSGTDVIGLLRLSDARPDRFTDGMIGFLEGLGVSIGIALHRKRTEERLQQLYRVNRAVRAVDQVIVREKDAGRLIREACGVLVEQRGYDSVLLVSTDAAGKPSRWAQAGMGAAFEPLAALLGRGELPPCCRGAGRADGPRFRDCEAAGCRACRATDSSRGQVRVPLEHGGRGLGFLVVSLEPARASDLEELGLLTQMAGDVAFALHGMEQERAVAAAAVEHARLEREMRQAQKMEAVGRLAGGVAHDFNNALCVVLSLCELIEGRNAGQPELLADVRSMAQAGRSAARLTRQLLAFSRRQVLEPRSLDLNAVVKDLESMVRPLLGEDVAIRLALDPSIGRVLADPGQLEQVLMNLAVNARDAMPRGGTLTVATAPVVRNQAPFVRLSVVDDGCGMDEATKAHMFEPFFTTKAKGKGTGLGLSTVYGIVGQCSGFVEVESEPGRGSTFALFFPVSASALAVLDAPASPPASVAGTETVLVVDDDEAMRVLVVRILRHHGYRAVAADGLAAARRVAAAEPVVHLVLTDVVMLGGSGPEVGAAVLAVHPSARVLYMTGYTDEMLAVHGVLNPGVQLLMKPFTSATLGLKVRQVLDGGAVRAPRAG